MEEIKSVRVRVKSIFSESGARGDYKVTVLNRKRKFRVDVFQGIGPGSLRKIGSTEYSSERRSNLSTEELADNFINDGIETLIRKPVSQQDGTPIAFIRIGIEIKIIQDPWLETPPKERIFGSDPYYLNNGSAIFIEWIERGKWAGGDKWSDFNGNELKVSRDNDSKFFIDKKVEIWSPDALKLINSDNSKIFIITRSGIEDRKKVDVSTLNFQEKRYSGSMLDIDIIKDVLFIWNSQIPNYNVSLCDPDNEFCELIDYISPDKEDIEESLQNLESDIKLEEEKEVEIIKKEKLNVIIPKDLKIKAREDISFKIYVGEPPKTELPIATGFDFGDEEDLSDLLLDGEFREREFDGLSEQEVQLQEEVSNNQEDYTTGVTEVFQDLVPITGLSPFSSLDNLLKLAGSFARILGKNPRVKYENLRLGYKKGIHGLCPQGTQAVLVAMTGIKELGLIKGNADWFAFSSKVDGSATGGFPWPIGAGFDKLINGIRYYDPKVRIRQVNGSWKGTYIQNKNMWQVGDIIACAYKGRKYGHIQIWTGFTWMSDFKQNAIQQRNVDPNTVTLWRLNLNGLDVIDSRRNLV